MTSSAAVVRAAVLGSPIRHSKSPQLHTAAYRFLGLDCRYTRIDLTESEAGAFLSAEAAEHTGFSVTMPLKTVMVQQMTSTSDRVSTLGTLNTITVENTPSGQLQLRGENTDVDGITAALTEAGLSMQASAETAAAGHFAVIGGGGTASAALAAAAELGFRTARVYVRSPDRAAALPPVAQQLGLHAEIRRLDQLPADLTTDETAAVVSTLPPHAADLLATALPPLVRRVPLLDVAYDPWPSALASSWQTAGGTVISGLQMLLHQAVKQVELFTAATCRPAAQLDSADRTAMLGRMRAAVGMNTPEWPSSA